MSGNNLDKGNIKRVLERWLWPQSVRMEKSHEHNMSAWIISVPGFRCWETSSSEADAGGIVGAFLAFSRVWRDFCAECYMKEPTPTPITPRWLPVPILLLLMLPHHRQPHLAATRYPNCLFAEAPSLPFFNCIILVSFGLPLILWGR